MLSFLFPFGANKTGQSAAGPNAVTPKTQTVVSSTPKPSQAAKDKDKEALSVCDL